jgi:hypothetical protein
MLVIVGNVLDGKPSDGWLEGVFDKDVEKTAFRSILREEMMVPKGTKEQGKESAIPEPSQIRDRGIER